MNWPFVRRGRYEAILVENLRLNGRINQLETAVERFGYHQVNALLITVGKLLRLQFPDQFRDIFDQRQSKDIKAESDRLGEAAIVRILADANETRRVEGHQPIQPFYKYEG